MLIGRTKAGSASMPSSCLEACLPVAPGVRLSFVGCTDFGMTAAWLAGRFAAVSSTLFASRGGFVRVKLFEKSSRAGGEDSPLELHRGRQLTALLRPLVGNKAESLDSLKVGQATVGFAHNFIIERNHPAIGSQFGTRDCRHSVLLCPGLEGNKIRRKQCRNELVLVTHKRGLRNQHIVLELVLNGLRSHQLAAGSLQLLFFAVCDVKKSIRIQVRNVAGAEPTFGVKALRIGSGF